MENSRYKFRAWDEDKQVMWAFACQLFPEQSAYNGGTINVSNSPSGGGNDFLEKGILMQFTGLKDKNGTEIYEGDVFDKKYHNLSVEKGPAAEVKMDYGSDSDGYSHGCWYGWMCGGSSLADIASDAIIIGNIHEHPELLDA